ncbi:hypothetical protein HCN44_011441 [Aphidius gifuensis]|uniref:NADH dehydrogenase [ubiquinone] flavoprotein 3, mitochondrial n=1 Tax=Aphidius gifuensis TaxID=684658 RepID=A0A835CSC4_APHGI|nr:hypothetical protein HCN44_011441 [Aphidius gifuensis]
MMLSAGKQVLSNQVIKTLSLRLYSQQGSSQKTTTPPTTTTTAINENVPGLSENCVTIRPGVSKNDDYKCPEYFGYNVNSFAEAEVEMAKFRLPAPSNKVKFES